MKRSVDCKSMGDVVPLAVSSGRSVSGNVNVLERASSRTSVLNGTESDFLDTPE